MRRIRSRAPVGAPGPLTRADIVGPVCESGDCFLQDWPLGNVVPNDLLVLWGAGAYGTVQTRLQFAPAPPRRFLLEGTRMRLIRRRESRADLVRGE